jgi:pellino protein
VWLPEHKQWFEVSVNGNLYAIEGRSAKTSNNNIATPNVRVRNSAFNRPTTGADGRAPVLTDGAIIDLGGVQLQFQTPHGVSQLAALDGDGNNGAAEDMLIDAMSPMVYGRGSVVVASVAKQLENLNVQCPVQLHQLRFTRPGPGEPEVPKAQVPHVFPACGHVFGYDKRIASAKTCPLCRAPGNLVQLLLKENSQLQSAAERHSIPECVLNPCGHAISSKLAAHYAALLMPNGRAICPFCAVHLDLRTPFSRLYLYSEDDY